MKLAYSTYATQKIDVYDALSRIRSIGYDAVEIAVADPWPTAPDKLDTNDRSALHADLNCFRAPFRSLEPPTPLSIIVPR